ncbi:tRNA pseudouridine(38-40) synthase TruA [Cetobacterium sp. 2G large]|uniref:tRNA pseudouridine(38-40) synthase TruA n=1 Tax=Cetobacterium sp. 2G large TaxID=2759680 RepID=UPI00163CD07F|nr:tRNA pseudouridine(38-40) synthase TruA [Cetobacterium sp. 2G large]
MERNIKLTYSYDGSEFFGFQRQPGFRTVQGELEKVLGTIFKNKIDLVSAGRTDRGVHAKKQVSNFYTTSSIPLEKIKRIINGLIPNDIFILDVQEVDLEFSSRFSATYRSYEYYIGEDRNPFQSRYVTFVYEQLDLERLNKIVSPLVGQHDFSNFRLSDCGSNTTIREIYEAKFERVNEKTIKLYVKGNAFLKSQIRIIVGTVLSIYFGKKPENYLIEMLKNPNIQYAKIVAEPFGLHLFDIGY